MNIANFPNEIIDEILNELDYADQISLARTSRGLNNRISNSPVPRSHFYLGQTQNPSAIDDDSRLEVLLRGFDCVPENLQSRVFDIVVPRKLDRWNIQACCIAFSKLPAACRTGERYDSISNKDTEFLHSWGHLHSSHVAKIAFAALSQQDQTEERYNKFLLPAYEPLNGEDLENRIVAVCEAFIALKDPQSRTIERFDRIIALTNGFENTDDGLWCKRGAIASVMNAYIALSPEDRNVDQYRKLVALFESFPNPFHRSRLLENLGKAFAATQKTERQALELYDQLWRLLDGLELYEALIGVESAFVSISAMEGVVTRFRGVIDRALVFARNCSNSYEAERTMCAIVKIYASLPADNQTHDVRTAIGDVAASMPERRCFFAAFSAMHGAMVEAVNDYAAMPDDFDLIVRLTTLLSRSNSQGYEQGALAASKVFLTLRPNDRTLDRYDQIVEIMRSMPNDEIYPFKMLGKVYGALSPEHKTIERYDEIITIVHAINNDLVKHCREEPYHLLALTDAFLSLPAGQKTVERYLEIVNLANTMGGCDSSKILLALVKAFNALDEKADDHKHIYPLLLRVNTTHRDDLQSMLHDGELDAKDAFHLMTTPFRLPALSIDRSISTIYDTAFLQLTALWKDAEDDQQKLLSKSVLELFKALPPEMATSQRLMEIKALFWQWDGIEGMGQAFATMAPAYRTEVEYESIVDLTSHIYGDFQLDPGKEAVRSGYETGLAFSALPEELRTLKRYQRIVDFVIKNDSKKNFESSVIGGVGVCIAFAGLPSSHRSVRRYKKILKLTQKNQQAGLMKGYGIAFAALSLEERTLQRFTELTLMPPALDADMIKAFPGIMIAFKSLAAKDRAEALDKLVCRIKEFRQGEMLAAGAEWSGAAFAALDEEHREIDRYNEIVAVARSVAEGHRPKAALGVSIAFEALKDEHKTQERRDEVIELLPDQTDHSIVIEVKSTLFAAMGEPERTSEGISQIIADISALPTEEGKIESIEKIKKAVISLKPEDQLLAYKQIAGIVKGLQVPIQKAKGIKALSMLFAEIDPVHRTKESYGELIELTFSIKDKADRVLALPGIGTAFASLEPKDRTIDRCMDILAFDKSVFKNENVHSIVVGLINAFAGLQTVDRKLSAAEAILESHKEILESKCNPASYGLTEVEKDRIKLVEEIDAAITEIKSLRSGELNDVEHRKANQKIGEVLEKCTDLGRRSESLQLQVHTARKEADIRAESCLNGLELMPLPEPNPEDRIQNPFKRAGNGDRFRSFIKKGDGGMREAIEAHLPEPGVPPTIFRFSPNAALECDIRPFFQCRHFVLGVASGINLVVPDKQYLIALTQDDFSASGRFNVTRSQVISHMTKESPLRLCVRERGPSVSKRKPNVLVKRRK